MLHSGHVAFFNEAARLGDLYVGIGSDRTIFELKGRKTINSEQERLFMVSSLKAVHHAWINTGSGVLDFVDDMQRIRPDVLFVNEDGHSVEKEKLCQAMGIEYHVSRRVPHGGLPARSTTALRQECLIPYRIDLAGGWLDQPYVSKHYPGPVITISIEPDYDFNDRSGMSTSTRKKAVELWHTDIPDGDREQLAKILFCYENPPGSSYVSGSQDSIGIVFPGINRLYYPSEQYWPAQIETQRDPQLLAWLQSHIYLLALKPRDQQLSVTQNTAISPSGAKALAEAAEALWNAVLCRDIHALGDAMTRSFHAQTAMFPNMLNPGIHEAIAQLPSTVLGHKLSGAGGGGYLVLISQHPIPNTLQIRIRR